jgi:hypothetical protein
MRLIHEPGDLPRTRTNFRWESDNLLYLRIYPNRKVRIIFLTIQSRRKF